VRSPRIRESFQPYESAQATADLKVSITDQFWLPHRHFQQRRDVVHLRLPARSDRLKPRHAQQVESRRQQGRHRAGAFAAEAVVVFMELGVTD